MIQNEEKVFRHVTVQWQKRLCKNIHSSRDFFDRERENALFRSIETTNDDLSAHPPPISQRQNKPVRAPSTDTKVLPAKPAVTRKTRGKFW